MSSWRHYGESADRRKKKRIRNMESDLPVKSGKPERKILTLDDLPERDPRKPRRKRKKHVCHPEDSACSVAPQTT